MYEAQPSRTALRVALRRAAHQVHDERPLVFDDPLAGGPAARKVEGVRAAHGNGVAGSRALSHSRSFSHDHAGFELHCGGQEVVFDYSQPREALPPLEQLMLDSLSARVALAGEPFQLFFTPAQLADELECLGLRVVEDLDGDALTARYFAGSTDGLALRGKAGRICIAAPVGAEVRD